MANGNNQKPSEAKKDVKKDAKPKEPKKKTITMVSIFKPIMKAGVKDKDEAVTKALAKCKEVGFLKTNKGNDITKEVLATHFNNVMRDIKEPRKGWWSTIKVVEEKGKLLKWVEKEA